MLLRRFGSDGPSQTYQCAQYPYHNHNDPLLLQDMDQNYYDYGLHSRSYAPFVNGYRVSMQPYCYNTAYPTSPSTYLSFPLSGSAQTSSNSGNVQGFSEAGRSPYTNSPSSNAVFPYIPPVSAGRPNFDAGDSNLTAYSQSRSQSSALIPYTPPPHLSNTGTSRSNCSSSQRQHASRNRAPSTANSSSCSTRSSTSSQSSFTHPTNSSTRSHRSTDVVHIPAGGVNVYIIYPHA
ncbi:hypothetical protein F5146DRAFT_1130536 [Armillaria mellea]|nr:hypothetical protein F5146DRAFT_1130536 [Armillaria mellea]